MRVWVVERPNGPFVEREQELSKPKAREVLVRIRASGINPLDTKIRAASAAHARQTLPSILGLDMAGVVEEVGTGVTDFIQGDEVFGMVGGVGGNQGTLAEYIAADASLLAKKPKSLTMREAAALPLVSITAWEGLVDRAGVHAEKTVLVHAAAGGVGNIAMQLALAFDARVFATVSPDKRSAVELSKATLIDYTQASVESYVREHTGGTGFDIVYDTLGGPTLDASFTAVKRYTGHVVSCLGWGTHALAPLSFLGATYSGVFTLHPLLTGEGRTHHGDILRQVAGLADVHKLRPLLHAHRFGTQDIESAFETVNRGALGKVVVDIT